LRHTATVSPLSDLYVAQPVNLGSSKLSVLVAVFGSNAGTALPCSTAALRLPALRSLALKDFCASLAGTTAALERAIWRLIFSASGVLPYPAFSSADNFSFLSLMFSSSLILLEESSYALARRSRALV